jgi:hypothetical protein
MTLHFRLEQFACGLTRQDVHESAQMIVRARVDLVVYVSANAPHVSSPPRPS